MSLWENARRAGRGAAALLLAIAAFYPTSTPLAQGARGADSAVASGMSDNGWARELVQDMQQMHLTVCASKVQQVMTFLFDGQDGRFEAQPLGPDSDRWPALFIIESAAPAGGRTRLSTLMISPSCAGMYEQVLYWGQPCATVRSTVFGKFTGDRVLLRDVKVAASGPALEVYLTPAGGGGCVSVKKELFR